MLLVSHKRQEIRDSDLQGLKVFQKMAPLLERLHGEACQRDRAHNRTLHMDQYMLLLLLYMFNPMCVSLRALDQASGLKKVQKQLGVARASVSSMSEAARLFDADLLVGIIEELAVQLNPMPHDPRLDELSWILTVVDGTLLKGLPQMAWALWLDDEHRAVKAHVEFEVLKGVPVRATLTEGNGDERDVLEAVLLAGRLYVLDRGYARYTMLQKILDAQSHFVCRIKDDAVFEVIEERVLTDEDTEAGILRDAVVWLGSKHHRHDLRQPVRIVEIQCTPHLKANHTGRGGPTQGDTILLVTDVLDIPVQLVSLIYRYRWQIEVFFRSFKHLLGCRHLLSHDPNGIRLEIYAAMLACMLIALYTGRKPTRRTIEMFSYYLMGWADEDEWDAHIAGLKKQA
jgi:hypothetical protein